MKPKILLLLFLIPQLLTAQNTYRNWTVQPNTQKEKIALIIANNHYQSNGDLTQPIPTAKKLVTVLEKQGVDVLVGHDLNREALLKIFEDFAKELPNYQFGIVFYMGHGFQIDGENYLIPIDANPKSELQVKYHAIDVDDVLQMMDRNPKQPKVIVLDACRNNPFEKHWTSVKRSNSKGGFRPIPTPRNAEIFFSTQKDSKVNDNNPYMQFFMEELKKGGCLDDMVRNIKNSILENKKTENQIPARYGVLSDKICFLPPDLIPEGMVFVQGGSFQMGCIEGDKDCQDDEKPSHQVILDDFYIGKYEVTNAEYCEFLNAKGNQTEGGATWLDIESSDCLIEVKNKKFVPKSGFANHPVVEVTWYGANAYAEWKGMRLPTEAEWEYAARSRGKNEIWAGTSNQRDLAQYGNFCDKNCDKSWKDKKQKDGYEKTAPVGKFQPNDLGIYDMSGNVWEWCADWYAGNYYQNSPKMNPINQTKASYRVLRGGGWSTDAVGCRSSDRRYSYPDGSYYDIGFRLAHSL